MENPALNDATIRAYLLGRLEADSYLVGRIDEQMLSDAEFSENVDVVEDEIIEEYLEGSLDPADQMAVQNHFLCPPERQRKLRIARALGRQCAVARSHSECALDGSARSIHLPPPQSWPRFRLYAKFATAFLLVMLVVSLVLRQFRAEIRQSEQRLAGEREQSAVLKRQLDTAREFAQPATVTLTLLQPGIARGGAHLPQLRIGTQTQSVHVEIALTSSVPGRYNLQLQKEGQTVWSQFEVEAFTSSSGSILMFDISVQSLTPGESKFVVSDGIGREISYPFEISKQ